MRVALALQIVGLVAVTAGCAWVAPWLGLIVGGLLCAVFGIAAERGSD